MLEKCAKAAVKHLSGVVDDWYVYNDGSDAKHHGAYERAYKPFAHLHSLLTKSSANYGVAYAKNRLLEQMLYDGADWLFLLEDDIRVLDERAVTGYIDAAEKSGLDHLSFAHHGPANADGPIAVEVDGVAFYPHAVGAWCLYSRDCLKAVGLFDEKLVNAWEHVEHTMRLAVAGYTTGPYRFADAAGSQLWLEELPNSIAKSSIRPRPDWHANIVNGLAHWRQARPDTFALVFGPGTPLEAYAASLLGAAA
jgi:hypothetical protein